MMAENSGEFRVYSLDFPWQIARACGQSALRERHSELRRERIETRRATRRAELPAVSSHAMMMTVAARAVMRQVTLIKDCNETLNSRTRCRHSVRKFSAPRATKCLGPLFH